MCSFVVFDHTVSETHGNADAHASARSLSLPPLPHTSKHARTRTPPHYKHVLQGHVTHLVWNMCVMPLEIM